MAWYYHLNGENHGPVPVDELQNLQRTNVIATDTLVWTEGMAQWEPYQSSSVASSSPGLSAVAAPNLGGTVAATQVCAECGKRFPEDDMLKYENSWVCATCKPIFFQRIKEGAAPVGTFIYASVLKRFVAIFIDGIIIDIFVFVPIIMLAGLQGLAHKNPSGTVNAIIIIAEYLFPALYEILFIGTYGATPGKMLMKIKVIGVDGSKISYARSTGRYFAKMLSGIILLIGYLMAIWDDQKRALHDRICKTLVVVSNPS